MRSKKREEKHGDFSPPLERDEGDGKRGRKEDGVGNGGGN